MKIIARIEDPDQDWRRSFAFAIEIDDQFQRFYKKNFLEKHFIETVATALCDLHDPSVGLLMSQVNDGLRDLKEKIVAGLDLSLELYDRQNANKKENFSSESKAGELSQ